jgi:7-cyano-7-deazaguanine synthase
MQNKKHAVVSLSGGMDSSTLLLHLLNEGYDCTCLSFDYGQKHKVELERATELVKYINKTLWQNGAPLSSQVTHQIIKLDGLSQLLNSSLVEGGSEVPEGHYENENMKATVVPNRNMIFSSIVQSVALSIATKHNIECVIALGLHSGDHAVYPDTTEIFRQLCLETFRVGNWESHLVDYYAPYMETNKFGILEDGAKCCELLGLDFDEVYKHTNTSYKPICIEVGPNDGGSIMHVGMINQGYYKWYSDYKSASSVERVEAFIKLGRPDPTPYANENGPVTWETVVEHVTNILENHNK